MPPVHAEPCSSEESSFCLNGGICYRIPSASSPSCVCNEDFKGTRCEEFQLPIKTASENDRGLIAAVVIISVLIALVLIAVIYCAHRTWKEKKKRAAESLSKKQIL
ncbi:pro-neuregulin-4, membrane-bound isoform-like [Erpetoichthys calabaricus]|uniref:pro-neuregulin-4, membrane-bound isoform-like n=1 Tax=Erpetoichthys calabaricus TaxID=27687 RepID=UPI00109EFE9B|nr:pro-neuregulin-4, membrane-bound isoform-like [Erpetoichthys calabaricus]